jgi:hypothetical protein
VDGLDLGPLVDNDLFVDAVVTATRTVEHTHQEEKISALRLTTGFGRQFVRFISPR